MSIREMTVQDLEAVSTIGHATTELTVTEGGSTFWSERRLKPWIEAAQDIMLVAEDGGDVVGFIITQLHPPSEVGYVSDVVVKEDARGQGIGTTLVREAIDRMKDLGLTYIYALTQSSNENIQNLLQKEGFKKGETMIWFELKL